MGALADILIKLGWKLVTERFVARVTILGAWELAQRTKPLADDEIVIEAAQTWGIKLPPKAE